MAKYKLERYRSAGLSITVGDVKRDYKIYGKTKVRIGATQDLKTGKVITGLTKEDEKYFEEEMGLDKGTLSPSSTYWRIWGKYIGPDGIYLDDEMVEDALAIKVISARSDVATSTHEAKTKLRAASSPIEYILTNAESEADGNLEKNTYLMQAMLLLNEMNIDGMREHLVMLGSSPYNMSDKLVRSKVSDLAANDSKKFVEMCNDPNKKELLFINELVNYAVVKKFGQQFLDSSKQVIAFNTVDMISFIKNPENSKQVIGLKKELGIKKKERV